MALAEAAATAREVAARHAADGDRDRALHPSVLEAIVEAGFARQLVPRRWGGEEGTFRELTERIGVLGAGCTSAAWLASLFAYSARFGAYLPDAGQAELWAKGADTVVVAALVPSGQAVPASGGWSLTGKWPYSSGAESADWAFVCVWADTPTGPDARFAAVPRSSYSIVDSWATVGMRATASHTLRLHEVIVPESLVFRRESLLLGQSVGHDGPSFRAPLRAVSGLTFAAPLMGAAKGAIADQLARQRDRPGTEIAMADAEADAAALLLRHVADVADSGLVHAEDTARGLRDAALAAQFCHNAIGRLVRAGGTASQSEHCALQRFWRDVNTACSHVALRFDKASALWCEQAASKQERAS